MLSTNAHLAHRALLALTLSTTAGCFGGDETDDESASGRAQVLDASREEIVRDALSASPSQDFIAARGKVQRQVSSGRLAYARGYTLTAGRGAAFAADPQLRVARVEAASALKTSIDAASESDAASAQQTIDLLIAQVVLIRPGATNCEALGGTKALDCAVALLILDVQRSEGGRTLIDAGTFPATAVDATVAAAPQSDAAQPPSALRPAVLDCADPLVPPTSCDGIDAFEPNTRAAPAVMELTKSCGRIESRLLKSDDDGFRFTAKKSDPVLVRYAYQGSGTADVDFAVYQASSGSHVASNTTQRSAPTESAALRFQAVAGGAYDVEVYGSAVSTCNPYTFSVDLDYCTDAYEDNDSSNSATKLVFGPDKTVSIDATGSDLDDDHYQFTAEKRDPIRITGSYAVADSSQLDLDISVYNATGSHLASSTDNRSTPEESWSLIARPEAAGSILRLAVHGASAGCAPYKVQLNAGWCTDAFEDNDTTANATPLTAGQTVEASVVYSDQDHYDLSTLAQSGKCTLTYTLATDSPQTVDATIYSRTGSHITGGSGEGAGAERSLVLTWNDSEAATLRISADEGSWCQPYTLRCEPQ